MQIILIIWGIILTLIGIFMGVYANFNLGIMLTLVAGIFFLLWGGFYKNINEIFKSGVMKYVKYTVVIGFSLFFIICVFLFGYGELSDVNYSEDAVIVLGAGIRGQQITYPLKTRLDGAIEYYKKNNNAVIIVSGGQGPQELITEAEAMENYLIVRGIPGDKIIKEEKAKSTAENLKFSKEILDKKFSSNYEVVIITNGFHSFRANYIAKKLGINSTRVGTPIQLYSYPPNYIREVLAVLKTVIIGE